MFERKSDGRIVNIKYEDKIGNLPTEFFEIILWNTPFSKYVK